MTVTSGRVPELLGRSRRVPELLGVALATQTLVDPATAAHQDLLERRAEVSVEPGVDDRVEKAVGVAEPQQKAVETVRDAGLRVVAPWLDESQEEERKPASSERAHDDAERLGRLAVVRRRYTIQSRPDATATTQTRARVETFRRTVFALSAVFRGAQVLIAGASGTYPELSETHAVALRCQRHAQHVVCPNVGQRPSTKGRASVVASRPGLGHRQPGRHHIYTTIDDDHQGQRNVERAHGGVDLVAEILAYVDFSRLLGCLEVQTKTTTTLSVWERRT